MYHIRRRAAGLVALLLTLCILAGAGVPALLASNGTLSVQETAEKDPAAQIAALREEIQLLQAEQTRLETEATLLKTQVEGVLLQKTYLDQQIALLAREISCYDELLTVYDGMIAEQDAAYSSLSETASRHFDQLVLRLRQSYEEGKPSVLELASQADSLIDFLAALQRQQQLEEYDRSLMESAEAEQGNLAKLNQALNQLRGERYQIAARQAERRQLLNDQLRESGDYLSTLENSPDRYNYYLQMSQAGIQIADQQIAKALAEYLQLLESNEAAQPSDEKAQRLALLSDTIRGRMEEGVLQRGSEFYDDGAEYIWPLEMDALTPSTVLAQMGYRTHWVDGKVITDYHSGMDLSATYGTNVVAAASGKVISVGQQDGYGNYVVLRHESGAETRYAHLSEITVQAGDYVLQGEVIGGAGCTGNSFGVGCHFELRLDGKLIDPAAYLTVPAVPVTGIAN